MGDGSIHLTLMESPCTKSIMWSLDVLLDVNLIKLVNKLSSAGYFDRHGTPVMSVKYTPTGNVNFNVISLHTL